MRTKSACYFAFAMQSTRQTRLTTRKRSKLSRHAFEGGLRNSFENHTSSAAGSRLSWNRVEGSWYSAVCRHEVHLVTIFSLGGFERPKQLTKNLGKLHVAFCLYSCVEHFVLASWTSNTEVIFKGSSAQRRFARDLTTENLPPNS